METKTGRPRRYDLRPSGDCHSREAGWAATLLDELRERVYDQVVDLPQEGLDFISGETRLSIGRLMLHLGWAEAGWMQRLGATRPADLEKALSPGALSGFSDAPPRTGPAAELIALCRRVREEVTMPFLRTVSDLDATPLEDGSSIRGVLMHLQWHWVYHSGHIGLIRFEWGADYEWTFHRPLRPQRQPPGGDAHRG